MFTGIVVTTGTLKSIEEFEGDLRIRFDVPKELMVEAGSGDSCAISGVCLTMLEPDETGFSADVSTETMDKTSLGNRQEGDRVNLELAMKASDRFGGHLVSGHVDGVATLMSLTEDARSQRFMFAAPKHLARYIAPKGSVCLDGVSLTVNEVDDNRFSICIIPHTLEVTTFGDMAVGDKVNLEVDLIARYLDRLNQYDHDETAKG